MISKYLKIFGLLFLLSAGCGSNPNSDIKYITNQGQGKIPIYLVNQSNFDSSKLPSLISAINVQLQRDFKPKWGIDAELIWQDPPLDNKGKVVYIIPDFSSKPSNWAQAAGVHTSGVVAYISNDVCEKYGITTRVISHEVLEMLANPNVDPQGYECCDPVNPLSYLVNDTELVADFVFPNYYIPGSTGPWDYNGAVTGAMRVVPGGYQFQNFAASLLKSVKEVSTGLEKKFNFWKWKF